MSFASPGNPSWDTPDGRGAFYGDHSAAQAAAAGGDYVALACPIGEAGKHLIGCDLNGQRLWGLANRAFGDGRVYAGEVPRALPSRDRQGAVPRAPGTAP